MVCIHALRFTFCYQDFTAIHGRVLSTNGMRTCGQDTLVMAARIQGYHVQRKEFLDATFDAETNMNTNIGELRHVVLCLMDVY